MSKSLGEISYLFLVVCIYDKAPITEKRRSENVLKTRKKIHNNKIWGLNSVLGSASLNLKFAI